MMAITTSREANNHPRTNIGERAVIAYLQLRRSNFGTTSFINAIESMPDAFRVKRISTALRGDRDRSLSVSPALSRQSSSASTVYSVASAGGETIVDVASEELLPEAEAEAEAETRRVTFSEVEVPPKHQHKSHKQRQKHKSHSRHRKSHRKTKHHHRRSSSASSSASGDLSHEYSKLAISRQLIPEDERGVLESFNELIVMVQILMMYYWTYCMQRYSLKQAQRENDKSDLES